MIVEYIRYNVDGGRGIDFEAAYGEARASLDASPHCLAYELARCSEEPARYILRIEWDSPEGHMQGFRTSSEFKTFFAAVRPYLGDIEEMRHYEATGVSARKEA
jgi:quinol monooxygenase YgiN